ncbi:MAG: energy transducer TonB [Agriterribacter sp.]
MQLNKTKVEKESIILSNPSAMNVKWLPIFLMIGILLYVNTTVFAQQTSDTVKTISTTPIPAQDTTFSYTDAKFPGGQKAWMLHILHTTTDMNLSGPVGTDITVTFRVEETGNLTNIQSSDPKGPLRDAALEVVKTSGRWIPAYRNGKPIACELSRRITFKLY